jgi:hypothetical protein
VAAVVGISVVRMASATATHPLVGVEGTGRWIRDFWNGEFADTALTPLGLGHGWLAMTPFFVLVLAALVTAALTAPVEWASFSWPLFATTIGAWGMFALSGAAGVHDAGTWSSLYAVLVCAAACLLVVAALPRERPAVSASPT